MPQNRSFSQQVGGSINIKKFKTRIIRNSQLHQEEETPVVVYHQDEGGGISLTGDQILPMSKRRMQVLNALKSLQNQKKLPMVLSSTPGFGNSDLEEDTPKPIKVAESRNQLLDLTSEPSKGRGNGSMRKKRNFFVDNGGGTFSA